MKKSSLKRVGALLLAVLLMVSMTGCIESQPSKENGGEGVLQGGDAKEQTFALNETAVFSTLKITATEVKESKGDSFFGPDDGNVFVGVKFMVENISDEEQTVSSLLLFDAYADDVSCDLSITAATAFDGGTIDGTIAAGKKLVGWYAMEVPKDWKTIELQVKSNWLSSASAKFVFTK